MTRLFITFKFGKLFTISCYVLASSYIGFYLYENTYRLCIPNKIYIDYVLNNLFAYRFKTRKFNILLTPCFSFNLVILLCERSSFIKFIHLDKNYSSLFWSSFPDKTSILSFYGDTIRLFKKAEVCCNGGDLFFIFDLFWLNELCLVPDIYNSNFPVF